MKQLPILQVTMHKKANFPLCGEIGVFFLRTGLVFRLLTKIFGSVWLTTVDAQLFSLLVILDLADMVIFG